MPRLPEARRRLPFQRCDGQHLDLAALRQFGEAGHHTGRARAIGTPAEIPQETRVGEELGLNSLLLRFQLIRQAKALGA